MLDIPITLDSDFLIRIWFLLRQYTTTGEEMAVMRAEEYT